MDELVMLTSPLPCVAIGLILILHISSAIIDTGWGECRWAHILIYVLAGLNLALHIGVFALALIESAPAEELFLALVLSGAVGLISMSVSEWVKRKRAELNSREEEG